MADPLDRWGNSAFDTRGHVEVPAPGGAVRVDRIPGDTDSETRWSAPVAAARQLILRRRASVMSRWLRSTTWSDYGDFSYQGDLQLASRLVGDSRVGAVLCRWRRFELRVEASQVLLKVPTGNVDASEARQGVAVVVAVRELAGP